MLALRCSVLLVVLLTGACATTGSERTPEATSSEMICAKETPTGSNRPQMRCRPRDDMYRTQQSSKALTEQMTRTRSQTPMAD